MDAIHSVLMIAVIALVTILLRFLPFRIFGGGRKTPRFVLYLSRVLPPAILGMLVVFCLRGTDVQSVSSWLPAAVGVAAVALLQWTTKRSLVSILGGTALYMVLIHFL